MDMNADDKLAIHELLSRAALGYDARDLDMLRDCFAEQANMSMRIADGDLIGPYKGRDEIMELMTSSMAQQTDVRRHVISNIFFAEQPAAEAGEPLVVSNLTLLATENGKTQLLSAGVYRDRVSKVGGVWHIVERHLDLDSGY